MIFFALKLIMSTVNYFLKIFYSFGKIGHNNTHQATDMGNGGWNHIVVYRLFICPYYSSI